MYAAYTHNFAFFSYFEDLDRNNQSCVEEKCREYKPNENKWVTRLCISEQYVLRRGEALTCLGSSELLQWLL